jgi:hypothetical protein
MIRAAAGLIVTLLLTGATPALAQPPAVGRTAIAVPRLDYSARTLANGTRDYAIRDTSASTASINASTHFDYTNHYIAAPPNRLESLVWQKGGGFANWR